ncbi:hypothetical protein PMAYCL1PPCAC_10751 [Pristionchus mayeri]|uniref:Uncharacterized protein n=1 Tax=Pristionchus mayeri TaxID=1317129 RepID=A0AAN4ZKA6_9BILA|nr:hypothetical protein PMAYCL1PPCAC_10751 [Pristionchus mayeri]
MDIVTAYVSNHFNDSVPNEMENQSESENDYKIWTDYLNNRRFKHLQGLKNFRSIAIEPQDITEVAMPNSINIAEILIICVCAIFLFLLLRLCLHYIGVCQERKGYEEF